MNKRIVIGLTLLSAVAAGSQICSAQATQPFGPPPVYPSPYIVPSKQQIMTHLDALRTRLEANTPTRLVQGRGGRGMQIEPGAAGNFQQTGYPMGVVYAGMLNVADATGDVAYSDYVAKHFQFFQDNLSTPATPPPADAAAPAGFPGRGGPFRQLLAPAALDDCGAIGSAIIKARRAKVGPDMIDTINRFADYISTKQFRLDDGTLARQRPFAKSIWGDDMYMSVPFLAQMGALTGDHKYFDDAAKQVLQIGHYLWVPQNEMFTHAWNAYSGDLHPKYYWGRANGWCMMAMAELLTVLPEDHPDRAKILDLYRHMAQGIAGLQSGTGLWHQMLDRPDSYLETSCSAMFSFAIARGITKGWLDAQTYGPVALAGWNGVTTQITTDGKVNGVCPGTSYADDFIYYYHRPAADDVHGYGPVLLAGSEIIRLLAMGDANGPLRIVQGQPIYFLDKQNDPQAKAPVGGRGRGGQ